MDKDNLSTEPKMRNRYQQFSIDGVTILEAFTKLTELMAKYGKDAKVQMYAESSQFDVGYVVARVVYQTEETKDEILQRIQGETNRRKNEETVDRRQYEYLKKKFKND